MFRSWLIVAVLLVFFGGAAVLAVGSGFRAKGVYARMDSVAAVASALVMAAVGLGGAPIAAGQLEMVLAVVLAWFVASIGFRARAQAGNGRLPALYGAVVTVLAVCVLFSAARGGGSATDHPVHELPAVVGYAMGGVVMVFAAAGWLLATFAHPPRKSTSVLPRLTGIREALMAAGLAVALYAIS